MGQRLDLQSLLETFTPHVYFQPPINIQIQYPCIVYKRDFADEKSADDIKYLYTQRYLVTVIDRNPDSAILSKVAGMPMSSYNRHFATEDLNHDVFYVYF